MKKALNIVFIFVTSMLLVSCTQQTWSDLFNLDDANPPVIAASDTVAVAIDTTVVSVQTAQYDSLGQLILDFVPAVQPYLHEACNTAWDNLSAIVNQDGTVTYFTDLPAWTADPTDIDRDRFTFIYQVRNPWYGNPQFPDEQLYTCLQTNWMLLPVDDYGILTCSGLQELRIWVLDELTNTWYMNSQVVYAVVLCNGQDECNQGYTFDQIEFTPYDAGYLHVQPAYYIE